MSNFLYLFRGGEKAYQKLSQEEKQAHMEVWGQWMGKLKEKGQLLDGLPLAEDGRVVHNRGELVTNGPFAEGAELMKRWKSPKDAPFLIMRAVMWRYGKSFRWMRVTNSTY